MRRPALAKWIALAGVALAATLAAAEVPPPPPLPSLGWPLQTDSEPYAQRVLASVPAADLESALEADPALIPPVMRTLGAALMTSDEKLRGDLERYLTGLAKACARRGGDLRAALAFQVVDPYRFRNDADFRARVLPLLPRMLDEGVASSLRDASLRELVSRGGIDFDTAESVAVAWKLAPRRSVDRRTDWPKQQPDMPDDAGPIEASIFSLDSSLFAQDEVRAFLASVKKASPKRRIVVVGDAAVREVVQQAGADFVDGWERPFSPWPRDPFIVARTTSGLLFVNRPNLQPKREADANLVRALVQGLPADLDAKWKPAWTTAAVPFHNGHVLLTPTAAWISIHTVELRALEILGLKRVPTETFDTPAGIEKYLEAVFQAAGELGKLYGRPVQFVHPIAPVPALMAWLGGGAGFDLDSLVTILPSSKGRSSALVGSAARGTDLARKASQEELATIAAAYRFTGDPATLGQRLAEAQASPRGAALGRFLDTVAEGLAAQGMQVTRLPLLNVPASMVEETPADFLMTWNNVVLETREETRRAEGFASLLSSGDDAARAAFRKAGWTLDLHPPLVNSIVLGGGYRCASNHVRAARQPLLPPVTSP